MRFEKNIPTRSLEVPDSLISDLKDWIMDRLSEGTENDDTGKALAALALLDQLEDIK